MAILITGGSGVLGRELKKVFLDALVPTRKELDITDCVQVSDYISEYKPKIIIHTAALTNVRLCEIDRPLAFKTNVLGTRNIVQTLQALSLDCYLVFISTACVFRGDVGNYDEQDLPYPKNYYSLTKHLAEFEVYRYRKVFPLIIRTNFVGRTEWKYPRAFTDRFGTYLFADDVALAVEQVIASKIYGLVHVCGDQKMSMFDLAKINTQDVQPMTMEDYEIENMFVNVPELTVDMSLTSKRIKPFRLRRKI